MQVGLSAATQFRLRWLSLLAAERLHAGMLTSLLHAPVRFFHSTPSGRVTNRLTKDTSDIDRNLAFYAAMWFQSMLQLLSTAAVVGAVTPFLLPFLVPLLLLFGLLYLYFQASVREVKRLDAVARSPIFTAVSNALTVRAAISAAPALRRHRCSHQLPPRIAVASSHACVWHAHECDCAAACW
jgi:ABC-type multidrug transport system fused ATPase/permease subunit